MRRVHGGATHEALGFWAVALGICLVAGIVSYEAGKYWVGRQLAQTFAADNRPRPVAGTTTDEPWGNSGQEPPPSRPKVELEPRAPSDAEEKDLVVSGPQDATSTPGSERSEDEARGQKEQGPPASAAPSESVAAPSPPASRGSDPGYLVTAGSYTVAANAERVRGDLEARGYHPYITELQQRGVTYHRVVVGVYGDRSQAEEVRRKLDQSGFVSGVVAP
jgi:cell division protein FtsN